MNAETFAVKLKRLREAAGLSQPQLAEQAGMNRFGVAKLEQGVREPGWATVQALAKALGVNCLAFADDPDAGAATLPEGERRSPPKRGRPRKEPPPAEAPAPSKPRGKGKGK